MPPKRSTGPDKRIRTSSRVFMVVSKNDYAREAFVQSVISERFGSDYIVENLTLDEDLPFIENVFNVRSLVSTKKVIRIAYPVKALAKKYKITKPRKKTITYEDKLVGLVGSLSDDVIVFLFPDGSDKRKALQKLCADKRAFVEIQEPSDDDISKFIESHAKEIGLRLDKKAIAYILDNVSKDTGVVRSELDKLCLYNKEPSLQDVKDIVVVSSEVVVFDLIDAIAHKDKRKTFTMVDSYMATSDSVFSLIALLQRSFRLLYCAVIFGKDFADKMHMSQFVAKKYTDRVKLFGERELVKELMFLLEYECKLKQGVDQNNAVYDIVLELLK